jgi:hypothetical protein
MAGLAGAIASIPLAAQIGLATETHRHIVQALAEPQPRSEATPQTVAMLRDLWIGHIFWVRSVSLAVIESNDAAMQVAEQRAVTNAQAIAAFIEPFYGSTARKVFANLLIDHYRWVKVYLAATMSGSVSIQSTTMQSLISNADEIAVLMSKLNPYLPTDELRSLLRAHASHHLQQIRELMLGNFIAEAETWEEMKSHVYQIADTTAHAIVKQFREQFPAEHSG